MHDLPAGRHCHPVSRRRRQSHGTMPSVRRFTLPRPVGLSSAPARAQAMCVVMVSSTRQLALTWSHQGHTRVRHDPKSRSAATAEATAIYRRDEPDWGCNFETGSGSRWGLQCGPAWCVSMGASSCGYERSRLKSATDKSGLRRKGEELGASLGPSRRVAKQSRVHKIRKGSCRPEVAAGGPCPSLIIAVCPVRPSSHRPRYSARRVFPCLISVRAQQARGPGHARRTVQSVRAYMSSEG